VARFNGGERKTVIVGTDSVRFNADNFALAALEKRLPFQITTTSYVIAPSTRLPRVNASACFIYGYGGDRGASFNTRARDATKERSQGIWIIRSSTGIRLPRAGERVTWSSKACCFDFRSFSRLAA